MKKSKLLSWFVLAIMVFTLAFSVAAFAEEEAPADAVNAEFVVVDGEAETAEDEAAVADEPENPDAEAPAEEEAVVVDNSARDRYLLTGGIAVGCCVLLYIVVLVLNKKGFKGFGNNKKKSSKKR